MSFGSKYTRSNTRRRFEHSWRRSWLLLYNSVVFYAAVALLELSGLDRLVAAFKPEITRLLATLSGRSGLSAPNPDILSIIVRYSDGADQDCRLTACYCLSSRVLGGC